MTREKIIGACLADPAAAVYVVENAASSLFVGPTFQVFAGIKKVYASGSALNFHSIISAASIDATTALMWVADSDPSSIAADLEALKRNVFYEIFRANSAVVESAFSQAGDVASAYHMMVSNIAAGTSDMQDSKSATMAELILRGHERSEANRKSEVGLLGLPTKWKTFNQKTEGLTSGLHIVGARPGVGKTTFAAELMRDQAMRDVTVGMISLEMTIQRIADRIAGSAMGVNPLNLVKGIMATSEFEQYQALAFQNWASRIKMDQPNKSSLSAVEASIYKLRGQGCRVIVGDHIHRLYVDGFKGNPEQAFSVIGRDLSALANDLDVALVWLAQVSRGVESRPDKRPLMSDIKYASTFEEVCETVSFLYRPGTYGIEHDENGVPYPEGYSEIIVRKARDTGATGIVELVMHNRELIELLEFREKTYLNPSGIQLPPGGYRPWQGDVPF